MFRRSTPLLLYCSAALLLYCTAVLPRARAAPISLEAGGFAQSDATPAAATNTFRWQFGPHNEPVLFDWRLHGITTADTGRTWSITEANAASYNFDWQAAQAALGNPINAHFLFGLWNDGNRLFAPSRLYTCAGGVCIKDFQLQEVEITLRDFSTSPTGSHRNASLWIHGDGRRVPEPTGVALITIACLGCCAVHRGQSIR